MFIGLKWQIGRALLLIQRHKYVQQTKAKERTYNVEVESGIKWRGCNYNMKTGTYYSTYKRKYVIIKT